MADAVRDVIKAYESGRLIGSRPNARAQAELASYGAPSVDWALSGLDLLGAGAGKLWLPYLYFYDHYKGCWPGPGQLIGDCVVQTSARAAATTMGTEGVSGKPDEETGKVEELPEVSPEAVKNGVLACEPNYHLRGHRGDGWDCASAANALVRYSGAVLRQDYGFVDLTKYSPKYAQQYYTQGQVPSRDREAFGKNRFRDAAECKSYEAVRDSSALGLGIITCGSEAWQDTRDENGVAKRASGTWYHALPIMGVDDRPEVIERYRDPLVLMGQTWGRGWGRGGRRILGTDIEIPEGWFWAKWSDARQRLYISIAGLNGWARRLLPDLKPGWN